MKAGHWCLVACATCCWHAAAGTRAAQQLVVVVVVVVVVVLVLLVVQLLLPPAQESRAEAAGCNAAGHSRITPHPGPAREQSGQASAPRQPPRAPCSSTVHTQLAAGGVSCR